MSDVPVPHRHQSPTPCSSRFLIAPPSEQNNATAAAVPRRRRSSIPRGRRRWSSAPPPLARHLLLLLDKTCENIDIEDRYFSNWQRYLDCLGLDVEDERWHEMFCKAGARDEDAAQNPNVADQAKHIPDLGDNCNTAAKGTALATEDAAATEDVTADPGQNIHVADSLGKGSSKGNDPVFRLKKVPGYGYKYVR